MNLSQALEHTNALVFPGFLSDDETLTAEREKNEEAIGLKWENVDLDAGMIKIRSVISSAGGKAIEKGPKTAAGRKDIPIDPVLVEKLKTRAK